MSNIQSETMSNKTLDEIIHSVPWADSPPDEATQLNGTHCTKPAPRVAEELASDIENLRVELERYQMAIDNIASSNPKQNINRALEQKDNYCRMQKIKQKQYIQKLEQLDDRLAAKGLSQFYNPERREVQHTIKVERDRLALMKEIV